MDAEYSDDISLLAITLTQAESLLHNLEQVTRSIGLHLNADEIEYICFNQKGDTCALNGGSLKLVYAFM